MPDRRTEIDIEAARATTVATARTVIDSTAQTSRELRHTFVQTRKAIEESHALLIRVADQLARR